LAVKINGNRGAQQEISVSTSISNEIMPFQQKLPIKECDVKMIQLDIRSRSRKKKSDSNSDSKCC